MAIAHRASAVANSNANTTSLTVTIPASVQTDDLLFLVTTNKGATTNPTVTDDDTGGNTWTRIGGQDNTGSGDVYWKRATSGSASKTVTVSGCTSGCSAGLSAFSGGSTAATPYENVTAEINGSGDETNAGFTPTQNGAMVCLAVCGVADNDLVSSESSTSPGALTQRFQHQNTGNKCAAHLASAVQATAGATGNLTWVQSNRATVSIGWDILPAAGPAPITIDAGAHTFAGTAVALKHAKKVALATGAHTFAGTAVSLKAGKRLTIASGGHTFVGTALTLRQAKKLALAAGAHTFAGTALTLRHGWKLSLAAGGHTFAGTPVTLTLLGALAISIDSGAHTFSGTAITLRLARKLTIGSGAHIFAGTPITFLYGREVAIGTGAHTFAGTDVSFIKSVGLSIELGSGAHTFSSTGITFTKGLLLPPKVNPAYGKLRAPYGWRVRRGRRERPDPYSW